MIDGKDKVILATTYLPDGTKITHDGIVAAGLPDGDDLWVFTMRDGWSHYVPAAWCIVTVSPKQEEVKP